MDRDTRVARTRFQRIYHDDGVLHKCTFPLMLAYAMTGHRAQGATVQSKVIIDIRSAFVPGLLYVILSRICERSQILLVGDLKPDMFCPIKINLHGSNEGDE